MTALLQAKAVTKSFRATPALRGADLIVDAGEIVALMGPSGVGQIHPAALRVRDRAAGRRFRELPRRHMTTMTDCARSALRRSQFGFIFQFGQLVPELTCRENLALSLRLTGAARRTANARADEWLDKLGVLDVAGQRPGEISGGQSQRVAVGRALVGAPQLIFADEPTGALDSPHGEQVMNLLVGAVRDAGAALVLVTHEARVAAYSHREILVRDGRTSDVGAAA